MNSFVYEVRPCTEDESGVAECEESEAMFWGVYERPTQPDTHGACCAIWAADFARKEDAVFFAEALRNPL